MAETLVRESQRVLPTAIALPGTSLGITDGHLVSN
jgi:hypothetical protein